MNYLKITKFYQITIVCTLIFIIGFFAPKLSTLLGIMLSSWLTFRSKLDGLLGLFILYLSGSYFYGITGSNSSTQLSLGPLPLDVQTLMCGFISLRVIIEIFRRPNTFKNRVPSSIQYLWLLAFIPACIGFYLGYKSGNYNWTRGLRWLMIAGSYFYGFILMKNIKSDSMGIVVRLLLFTLIPLTTIMLVFMNLNIYWSHHGFFFLGLGASFAVYYFRSSFFGHKFLGLLLLTTVLLYSLQNTFTTMGISLLSLSFSYLISKRQLSLSPFQNKISRFYGSIAIVAILVFTLGVLYLGSRPDFEMSLASNLNEKNLTSRFQDKILSDRLIFWYAALDQIYSGPYFIVPSGRLISLNIDGLPDYWFVGAHNVILETIRNNGLFSGGVIILIYFIALKNILKVLARSINPLVRTIASAIFSVAIVGMTTGDFPADQAVGFWLWSMAALCYSLYNLEDQINNQLE